MHISAKVEYAVRALLVLAAANGGPMSGAALAQTQDLPSKFLDGILAELRRNHIIVSQRGADGGYRLARDASTIALADIIRAIDGPLAAIRGEHPEETAYGGAAEHLQDVWIAVRATLRSVLETTTLADVVAGKLPANVRRLVADPDAWVSR
jgi:Rrf2 family protein